MNCTGILTLSAKKRRMKTILSDCYYEGALKITRPVYLEEGIPSIYLIHVGGGYVDGDIYQTTLSLEQGAELAVTTQSSTKVYRTPKAPVLQKTTIYLGQSSTLEYLPDPLIAYKGSKFLQETEVHAEEGSSLFYSDIITPGWAEDGSTFKYDWIRSKLKIYKGGKLVLFDHTYLEPDGDMHGLMQMEGYSHCGTFLIYHNHAGKEFLDELNEKMTHFHPEARFGMSAIPENGAVLRILARNSGVIEKMISHAHEFSRRELLGKERAVWRKY